jgi:hypothetical protein
MFISKSKNKYDIKKIIILNNNIDQKNNHNYDSKNNYDYFIKEQLKYNPYYFT